MIIVEILKWICKREEPNSTPKQLFEMYFEIIVVLLTIIWHISQTMENYGYQDDAESSSIAIRFRLARGIGSTTHNLASKLGYDNLSYYNALWVFQNLLLAE